MLDGLIEKWATRAIDDNWVGKWTDGAIFPRELVYFLATCEARGVERIIESGRLDGFSTECLAAYGDVVSIDWDEPRFHDRLVAGDARLAGLANVDLRIGDAMVLLGRAVMEDRRPTAVMIDGPKGYAALGLNLAAGTFRHVRVLGQHNLDPGERCTEYLKRLVGPVHYEYDPRVEGDAWDALGRAEKALTSGRSLDRSSLAVWTRRTWRVVRFTGGFRRAQPLYFAVTWRLSFQSPSRQAVAST